MSIKTASRKCWAVATAILAIALSTTATSPAQAQSTYQDFDSAVRLYQCSGSLIELPGTKVEDYALIMTSAHCLNSGLDRYLEPGEVIKNRDVRKLDKIHFKSVNLYKGNDVPKYQTSALVTDIVYATMDDSDVAILRLDKTYAELRQSDVKARPLSVVRPEKGTPIQIPSGYWKKAYSCQIDGFAPKLREGAWVWRDAIRYTAEGCAVEPGSSGSPVIDRNTGDIIGVNTTFVEGDEECTLNNACEVGADGVKKTFAQRGYATQTYKIPDCFKGTKLALNKKSCQLPKPLNVKGGASAKS